LTAAALGGVKESPRGRLFAVNIVTSPQVTQHGAEIAETLTEQRFPEKLQVRE